MSDNMIDEGSPVIVMETTERNLTVELTNLRVQMENWREETRRLQKNVLYWKTRYQEREDAILEEKMKIWKEKHQELKDELTEWANE